jgi:predicted nucleic acid-binding Zn ribbon protein
MSSQYKDNNFSTEKLSTSHTRSQVNMGKTAIPKRPNIDHLIKRLLVERRREKNFRVLVFSVLALVFVFLALNIN